MSTSLVLPSCGQIIELQLPEEALTDDLYLGLANRIPSSRIVGNGTAGYILSVRHGQPNLRLGRDRGKFRSTLLLADDIVAITSRVLEYRYWRQATYSVHSSAVLFESGVVLIAGKPRCGKTTLALDLCTTFDGKLISTDRTVVSRNRVLGGTQPVEAVRWRQQELACAGERDALHKPAKIIAIVYPVINPAPLQVTRMDHRQAFYALSRQAFYFLDEFPRVVYETRQVIPTLIHDQRKNKLLREVDALARCVPSFTISGEQQDKSTWIWRLANAWPDVLREA